MLLAVSSIVLALVACRSEDGAPASSDTDFTEASACEGKTCGVDCTPKGSDEPFNCNAAGKCVAAGEPLACEAKDGKEESDACSGKACGVDCTPKGGDEPFNCNAAGKCVVAGEPLGC
jgi:hypothetical protein